ncbi:4-hydroxy-tetrahydrodipicolinate synthase [Pelagibacterium limicola]|uniref:4-hydroxy-tetrahydrodipicolinate synthase n=1 Tax=Pelagibacterium limicola TaxID=2791022 RepID=UPI0018B0025D|nr:4-hydroxy-tetrahydrodipicolinate synthase [Pelagibacterium limicola]
MFSGSIPALITPFRNGAIDEDAFARLVKWQIDEGSNGLVPVGTTGESPTVSHEEHRRVIELTVEVAAKRVPVIAGAGSNSTREAVQLAEFAERAGADGILSIVPYYNRPNQEGQFQHFKAVAKATSLPVIVYSVPGRTVVDIAVDTIKRLRDECPNIVGIKDATSDMGRASFERITLGDDFVMLSGEDITALGYNAHGGRGCISVTANVAPALCAAFQNACLSGDYATALTIQDRLVPLHKALFIEPNPAGVKYAASRMGLCSEDLRLPMVPVTEGTRKAIDDALVHAGLING